MKRILIIGNYGKDNALNGQTARTRNVTNTLKKILIDYNVIVIDTQHITIKRIISFLINSIIAYKIIILPAQRSLYPIIKTLDFFSLLKKTTYIVIGGWLYEMVKSDNRMISRLKKLNYTMVQTETLKNNLLSLGIKSELFHNYRVYEKPLIFSKKNNRVVYYSRIREDKGILIAIDAIDSINKNRQEKIYFDIYGPIDDDFKEVFFSRISSSKYVKYYGILNDNNAIIEKLSAYYILLFPTYYEGEGFPGAILEAIIARLPVIASDWKYNKEIVDGNGCGFIFENKSKEDLIRKIEFSYENPDEIKKISDNCIKMSQQYTEENAISTLKKIIFGGIKNEGNITWSN